MSFASFSSIWPSLQSEIFKHLLYFQKFGGIPILIPFPVSTGIQASSSPKSYQFLYRESSEHAEGTTPGGQEKFTKSPSQWQQEIQLGCLLGSLHQRGFAVFPGKQLCPYPSTARQSLIVPRPSWFPTAARPQLSLGIFLQRNKQNPINLHFLPKSPRGGMMEMTRRINILGNYYYFIMLWNQERTDCLGKKFLFSLTCQVLEQLLGMRGEGGQGEELGSNPRLIRKVLRDTNKEGAGSERVKAAGISPGNKCVWLLPR